MKYLINSLMYLIGVTSWLAGIVLAAPKAATFFACIIPPYAWYLTVEHAMKLFGLN